jgi:hypothetical protein
MVEGAGAAVARDQRRTVDLHRDTTVSGLTHERLGHDLGLRVSEMHTAQMRKRIEGLVDR